MRRIKSFFGNQTFFGKNYKIFTFISSKSDIWQKMHVPCKNILDGQSLTAPCGRHRHKPASARRQRPARSRPPGRQSGQTDVHSLLWPSGSGPAAGSQLGRGILQNVKVRWVSTRGSVIGCLSVLSSTSPVVQRPPAPCNNGPISEHLGSRMAGQPGGIVLAVQQALLAVCSPSRLTARQTLCPRPCLM